MIEFRQTEEMLENFKKVQKNHEKFVRDFLVEMGMRTMRRTKKLTPVDTGELRNAWELSEVFRRGDELYIVLQNRMEYASHVEDGHMQRKRFVPGEFTSDGRFEYIPGHDDGMVLNTKWIPGHHMARIAISKVEREIPKRLEKALKRFFHDMGVGD